MSPRVSPVGLLAGSTILAFAATLLTIFVAVQQPWLGLGLRVMPETDTITVVSVAPDGPGAGVMPGDTLLSVGSITLEPNDLVEEPDGAESFAALRRFMLRQDEIADALRLAPVRLTLQGETRIDMQVSPRQTRPISSLPLVFWVQIASGLVSALVGTWVWSLRTGDASTRLLALAGWSVLIFAFAASVYSTRELALPFEQFRTLSAVNHFGALLFGVAMVALFSLYPKRLVAPGVLWPWQPFSLRSTSWMQRS